MAYGAWPNSPVPLPEIDLIGGVIWLLEKQDLFQLGTH